MTEREEGESKQNRINNICLQILCIVVYPINCENTIRVVIAGKDRIVC